MKKIYLSAGRKCKNKSKNIFTLVDDDDFEWLNQWCWFISGSKNRRTMYVARSEIINNKKTTIFMHREILKSKKHEISDHIDNNGLNNQRNNLRKCTQSQNCGNKRSTLNSSSKFKGVCWYADRNKWRVQLKKNGVALHLGFFDNEADAAKVYNKAALKYHKEFARLNVIN